MLAVVTVDTPSDLVDINDGLTSLREAVIATNLAIGLDTIEFAASLTASGPATIVLTQGELAVTGPLIIDGPGANLLTIDASGNDPTPDVHNGDGSRIFNIDNGLFNNNATVTIDGLTLTGGDLYSETSYFEGGAIRSLERLTLTNLIITDNAASEGGGLFSVSISGSVTAISDCVFSNNLAGQGGGMTISGEAYLKRVTVTANVSNSGNGGGANFSSNSDDPITVVDSVFSDNVTDSLGGGIFGGFLILRNSQITGNHAEGDGGGIAEHDQQFTLENNFIADNTSNAHGGGLHLGLASNAHQTITGNTFLRNEAAHSGGGIFARAVSGLTWDLSDNVISENIAQFGGGLFLTGDDVVPVLRNRIENNHATSDGGGIWLSLNDYAEAGEFRIEQNIIAGNTADGDGGGIWATNWDGNLSIYDNDIDGNSALGDGGGIYAASFNTISFGPTKIDFNRIVNNQAAAGGGAAIVSTSSDHVVEVTRNTIERNAASSGGGGLYLAGSRGHILVSQNTVAENDAIQSLATGGGIAIQNTGAEIIVSNSTISNNETQGGSGGGIQVTSHSGMTRIEHATIAQNRAQSEFGIGGGVFVQGGAVEIEHTLISSNTDGSGIASDLYNPFGITVSHSLIGNNVGSGLAMAPASMPDANGNIVGGVGVPIAVNLGALKNNGGPTRTHALLAGSAAIDAGDIGFAPAPPGTDQRGAPFARVYGGRVDIGAFERQPSSGATFVVSTLVDENDGNHDPGDLSLREAIQLANENSISLDRITFAPELTASGPATILLVHGELLIRDSMLIEGPGSALLTIDASGNDPTPETNNGDGSRIFQINDMLNSELTDVTIAGLKLTGGDVRGSGGAIFTREIVTVSQCEVSANASTSFGRDGFGGGGIASETASQSPANILFVLRSTISGNVAGDGGGIRKLLGELVIDRSVVSGNAASAYAGGGILATASKMTITNSTVSGNTAAVSGGGIANAPSATLQTTLIENSTISGNTANRGGGMFNRGNNLELRFATITGNTSPAGQGSGLASQGSSTVRAELYSTIVAGNTNSDIDFVSGVTNSIHSNGYNVIGTGNALGAFNQSGDQSGIVNPMLGPLADNGGPTKTHALLLGSPAINAGDSTAVANSLGVPQFDQRGAPYGRVAFGRIDVGAFELSTIPLAYLGDYNSSGGADAADYVVWRKSLGTSTDSAYAGADGDGDTTIDPDDYDVWYENYGAELQGVGAGGLELELDSFQSFEQADAVAVAATASRTREKLSSVITHDSPTSRPADSKDFTIRPAQILAASGGGPLAKLLISRVFDRTDKFSADVVAESPVERSESDDDLSIDHVDSVFHEFRSTFRKAIL